MARKKISCSFTTMLALELLREKLNRLYDKDIHFFQLDASVEALECEKDLDAPTISEGELIRTTEKTCQRLVNIKALTGPFERVFPDNQSDDLRRRLRRVEVTCRLYSIWRSDNNYTAEPQWTPHFLRGVISDDAGQLIQYVRRHYDGGRVDGTPCPQDACSSVEGDMCDSQMCVYMKFDRGAPSGPQSKRM